MREQIQKMTR
jgi:DNA primase large subunit